MNATEKLVAEWGIEAVNLRDVGREAEQRNNSVVQYHFGSKDILVGAVIDARIPALSERYAAHLDEFASSKSRDPGALAAALVDPLVELAAQPEDRAFLGFLAAILTAPHWQPTLVERDDVVALFERLADAAIANGVPADLAPSRLRLAWLMAVVALASRADDSLDEVRDEIVDAASGLIGAGSRQTAGSGRR